MIYNSVNAEEIIIHVSADKSFGVRINAKDDFGYISSIFDKERPFEIVIIVIIKSRIKKANEKDILS